MQLYLVQHGSAFTKEQDPNRALTHQGLEDIKSLAEFLKKANICIERVIHSGKLRAQQTAECIVDIVAPEIEIESSGLINPNDDPKAFIWQDDSWDKNTLVVGHLPFMANLVSYLLINKQDEALTAFKPGTLVCLECDDNKKWIIKWMITPDLL